MSVIRSFCLLLLLACSGHASAQRNSMPLDNFIDLPVPAPTTAARVKAAIVRGALMTTWRIVEDSDGSLIATRQKAAIRAHYLTLGGYSIRVRINYDANKYSLRYLDSENMNYRTEQDARVTFSEEERGRASDVLDERYRDWPQNPYMVRTGAYIHLSYEDDLRVLMTALHRHLLAPAP